jgi:hypothetical protein
MVLLPDVLNFLKKPAGNKQNDEQVAIIVLS